MSFFGFGGEKGPAAPVHEYKPEESEIMPHEVYNFIIFKCFDACVANFNNKVLDTNEKTCVSECITNIRSAPESFQKAHSFAGFTEKKVEMPKVSPFMAGGGR